MNMLGDRDDGPLMMANPRPQLVVDLSNVCRDRALGVGTGEAAWGRFVRVMHAWREQMGGVPAGIAIADASLLRRLTSSDLQQLRVAEGMGIVRSVKGTADPEILELASIHGARVLSDDRFRDYRGRHPWIQGCTDRFFVWESSGGRLKIVAVDMERSSPFTVSRYAEIGELRAHGLDARSASDRALLRRAYRCPNPDCLSARWHPDSLLLPPRLRGDQPRCPSCEGPLIDLGPRPAAIKLVLQWRRGAKLPERTLEEGQELELGRGDLTTDDPRRARISRRHLLLDMHDGRLRARDLGSRNGTMLLRWLGRQREYAPAVTLGVKPVTLAERDLLVLAGALYMRRSGERFAIALPELVDIPRDTGGTTDVPPTSMRPTPMPPDAPKPT